jgi:hypothetical protein
MNKEGFVWSEERLAIEDALYIEWKIIDDKLYCPDCYEYDEETDEYKPIKKEESR